MNQVVIVGIGEIADRPGTIEQGLDPLGLMAAATKAACRDAGVGADAIDAVDVVHQISWRYADTAREFCLRAGMKPARRAYHAGGGESPVRLLHEAALEIARGSRRMSLVVGGEARNTASKARRAGVKMPWPERASVFEHPWAVEERLHPLAIAHGVAQPTFVYPFYENALVAAKGQTPQEAHRESAELWAKYAAIAADNPYAWQRRAPTADEIAAPSESNRPIAYPYLRSMVANPTVNQGAAVLLMSEQAAIEAGIPPERRVYIVGGSAANEDDDYLNRDRYDRSHAQDTVLKAARDLANGAIDRMELYSCFPCVPKMASGAFQWASDVPTVTGGLSFFGGPFSNYMTHATAAMVRALRSDAGTGLLYGQGDFVTKHHALLLSRTPAQAPLTADYRVDAEARRSRGVVPLIVESAEGAARLETFTVLYDAHGAWEKGVAIVRTSTGARTMARVPATDTETLALLISPARSPVGRSGVLNRAADGLLEWRMIEGETG